MLCKLTWNCGIFV